MFGPLHFQCFLWLAAKCLASFAALMLNADQSADIKGTIRNLNVNERVNSQKDLKQNKSLRSLPS